MNDEAPVYVVLINIQSLPPSWIQFFLTFCDRSILQTFQLVSFMIACTSMKLRHLLRYCIMIYDIPCLKTCVLFSHTHTHTHTNKQIFPKIVPKYQALCHNLQYTGHFTIRIWPKSTQPIRCRSSISVPVSYPQDRMPFSRSETRWIALCLCD